MIKYLTFTQNARGCFDICCVLCGYLASLKHMGNQHAHIISGNIRIALWSTHTVMYLKEKSTQKSNYQSMMHPGSILFLFPRITGQLLPMRVMLTHHVVFNVDGKCQVSALFSFKREMFSSCADVQQSYRQKSISQEEERPASPLTGALIDQNAKQQPQDKMCLPPSLRFQLSLYPPT